MTSKEKSADWEHYITQVIHSLPQAAFAINSNKKIIAWNKTMEDITHTTEEEIIISQNYSEILYGDNRRALIDIFFTQL